MPSSLLLARSAQNASPLVEHVRRAFLVAGAVAERDRLEPVLLVEVARRLVRLEGVEPEARAPALRLRDEPAADAAALRLGAHVQLVDPFATQDHHGEDVAVTLGHPRLALDEDGVRPPRADLVVGVHGA